MAVSLFVSSGLMVDFLNIFSDGFMVQYVKLMASKFLRLWILLFDCFLLSSKCNLSEIFYQYAGDIEDNYSHTCIIVS